MIEYIKDYFFVMKLMWQMEAVAFLLFLVAALVVRNVYHLSWWVPFITAVLALLVFVFIVWAILRCFPPSPQ